MPPVPDPFSKILLALLTSGAQVYRVGGAVRDRQLGLATKDQDWVIRHLSFDQIRSILAPLGQLSLVGKSFGVMKFKVPGLDQEIDIALPRTEISTGTGHRDFAVTSDPHLPLEHDLARRDFTINAMAENLKTGELIDPFAGQADLKNKILRMVFREAFAEDPLRLLRAVQFAARFNLTIEPATLAVMREHAQAIKTVAAERIIEEIRKLFLAPKPSHGFDIMRDTDLLRYVFPDVVKMIGVEQPKKRGEDVYTHTMKVLDAARSFDKLEHPGDLNLMFAALFHDAGKPHTKGYDSEKQTITFYGHQTVSTKVAHHWFKQYRATTIGLNTDKVLSLISNHMFETKDFYGDRAIRRFVAKVGKEDILDLVDLRLADKQGGRFPGSVRGVLKLKEKIIAEINRKTPLGPKDLAIDGHDLITMGFKPGPLMGKILSFLVAKVLDDPTLNQPETLQKIVTENYPLATC